MINFQSTPQWAVQLQQILSWLWITTKCVLNVNVLKQMCILFCPFSGKSFNIFITFEWKPDWWFANPAHMHPNGLDTQSVTFTKTCVNGWPLSILKCVKLHLPFQTHLEYCCWPLEGKETENKETKPALETLFFACMLTVMQMIIHFIVDTDGWQWAQPCVCALQCRNYSQWRVQPSIIPVRWNSERNTQCEDKGISLVHV